LDHVSGARAAAEAGRLMCGTIDSWLVYRLTGGAIHVTDASNASRTLLMNIRTGQWDDELLECFGVPRKMLPEIRSSSEIYGTVSGNDVIAGIAIAGIAGDQQAVRTRLRQEHLRHRMLCIDEHRFAAGCLAKQTSHHRGLEARRAA
jgi:glycerol kinase